MNIGIILIGFAIYLLLGIVFLILFDLKTKRIRSKLNRASMETQQILIQSGNYVNTKVATYVFIVVMWLFWVAVVIGAMTDKKEGSNEQKG